MECNTNFVYVSDLLARRFPSVHEGLKRILTEHGIGFGVVQRTKDIWIRDYAPIQVDRDGSFVLFRYFPDYLRRGYRHLITDARGFIPDITGIQSCQSSDIILDGGNVVRYGDKAIVTDKVYRENWGMGREELRRELQRLLKVETLIVIPTEPGDMVGHADGVVRFVDSRMVLVNDYGTIDPEYRKALLRALDGADLDFIAIPYRPWMGRSRGMPPAIGCYVNYLQVREVLMVPSYGLPEDEDTCRSIRRGFPRSDVRLLDCRALAREGGVLNCVTWTIVA